MSESAATTDPMEAGDPMGDRPVDPVTGLRLGKNGERLCSAQRRGGKGPCGKPALQGMRVCRLHGGASPQARRKAALRLAELVDPAIATLAREMINADRSVDKQRAANSILDRAGVPRVTREITTEDSRTILLTRLSELRAGRAELPAGVTEREVGDALDVLDDDEGEER